MGNGTTVAATGRPIDGVLAKLEEVRKQGRGYQARCPAHVDVRASLTVTEADTGAVLLYCHAHCETKAVLAGLGLDWRDLYPDSVDPLWAPKGGTIEKIYAYTDEHGALLYEVLRLGKASRPPFQCRVPDAGERGGYRWKMNGARRVLPATG